MRKSIPDIDRMIMESHYLDSLEREDRSAILPEAERSQYLDTIKSLNDTIEILTSEIEALGHLIKVEQDRNAKNDEHMKSLLAEIKSLSKELKKYKDRNDRSNRDRFGKRSQKSSTGQESKPSRQEESDSYDGTPGSMQTEMPAQPQEVNEAATGQ